MTEIFLPPPELTDKYPEIQLHEIFSNLRPIWNSILENMDSYHKWTPALEDVGESRLIFSLSTILYPFYVDKKSLSIPSLKKNNLVEFHIKESLKLSNSLSASVNNVIEGVYTIEEILSVDQISEKSIAFWIREAKSLWPYSYFIYRAMHVGRADKADRLLELIISFKLSQFYEVKPLLNVFY